MEWRDIQCGLSLEVDENYLSLRKPYNETTAGFFYSGSQLSELPIFWYRPLNFAVREIHVLDLQDPCRLADGHVICGIIRHLSLNDNTTFVALSYGWGINLLKRPVVINWNVFQVTENLAEALERFQDADWILPIWIDAICIHQEDDVEKSSQVQEMRNMYRAAQLILDWLS